MHAVHLQRSYSALTAPVPARAKCALGGECMPECLRIALPEIRPEAVFNNSPHPAFPITLPNRAYNHIHNLTSHLPIHPPRPSTHSMARIRGTHSSTRPSTDSRRSGGSNSGGSSNSGCITSGGSGSSGAAAYGLHRWASTAVAATATATALANASPPPMEPLLLAPHSLSLSPIFDGLLSGVGRVVSLPAAVLAAGLA